MTAFILRFLDRCRNDGFEESICLNVSERSQAEIYVFQTSQHHYFLSECCNLIHSKNVKRKSLLISLSPFLDSDCLIRVGGRLRDSSFSSHKWHPIILSAKCTIAYLLIKHIHEQYFHYNKNVIRGVIFERFWIIGDRIYLMHSLALYDSSLTYVTIT